MVTVKHYIIKWTLEARNDLHLIFDYISRIESRERALHVVDAIRKEVLKTGIFPTKHPKEPRINNGNIRFTVKWSYKIVFEISGNTLRILSIFHTAQHPDKLHINHE
jgi:plasmid stabilization system protein ParE